jgi:hypothetical protein
MIHHKKIVFGRCPELTAVLGSSSIKRDLKNGFPNLLIKAELI